MRHSLAVNKTHVAGHGEPGMAELRVLLAQARAHGGADHPTSVRCGYDLGLALLHHGHREEAAPLLKAAERAARDRPRQISSGERMSFRSRLADLLKALGRIEEALALARENVRTAQAEWGPRQLERVRAAMKQPPRT